MGLVKLRAERRVGYITTQHVIEDLKEQFKGLYIVQTTVLDGRSVHRCYSDTFYPLEFGAEIPHYSWRGTHYILTEDKDEKV